MDHCRCSLAVAALLLPATVVPAAASTSVSWLDQLGAEPRSDGFRCLHLYLDSRDRPAGACLEHGSGLLLDLLPMETAPQAFVWISTPVTTDRGEPHTLEHLLLGKGRRGLAVAKAEEFRLSSSSAFTGQLETCYHFSTALSPADFLVELEDRLDALLHPDFSDEEIRREVCHVGPKARGAILEADEKGTVYTEMLSSWDHPWSRAQHRLMTHCYGADHPLAVNQGGIPEAIRRLEPSHIRAFHRDSHFLGNMGLVLVLPPGEVGDDLLARLDAMLGRLEPQAPGLPPRGRAMLPTPPVAVPPLTEVVEVPGARADEPALVLAAWTPARKLDRPDVLAAQILLTVVAQGDGSELHRDLLDPVASPDPLGAAWISGWISREPGQPVWLALGSVPPARVTAEGLATLRGRVRTSLERIAGWREGDPALAALKERALAQLTSRRRQGRSLLDHPPGFGQRGTGSFWADHLRELRERGGFHLRLDEEGDLAEVERRLKDPGNPFAPWLERMGLLAAEPHLVGTRSNPALLAEKESSRAARLEAFADSLERAYGTRGRQEALRRFQADYDKMTAQLEAERAGLPTPALPERLPLDNDPEIVVDTLRLAGGIPLCHGVFEGMQGARFSLAADLVGIGADNPWVAALPALLTQAGVDGAKGKLDFRQVEDALRREVSWAGAWLDADLEAGRGELVLGCAGATPQECAKGAQWLQRFLEEADWSEANRPRLREIVRRELANIRETRQGSEESWVEAPAAAWRQRHNPGLLRAGCFLTQEFDLLRCAWLLEDGSPAVIAALEAVARWPDSWTAPAAADSCRAALARLLDVPASDRPAVWGGHPTLGGGNDAGAAITLSARDCQTLDLALGDLAAMAAELPEDGPLWPVVCRAMTTGLSATADQRLDGLRQLRSDLLRHAPVRAWFTGGRPAWTDLMPPAAALGGLFPQLPLDRAKAGIKRDGPSDHPCLGLVHPGSSSGVVIISAPLTHQHAWERAGLVDYLAGNLLGGGGDQGLFMQTWAAGLAYSNGIRPRERTGLLRYYAERCPDAAQTLGFVEDCVHKAPPVDRARAATALVASFGGSRAALSYAERTGQRALELQVAHDPSRGAVPHAAGPSRLEEQRAFRQGLLDLLADPTLADQLEARKLPVHALVFPGLGDPAWTPAPGTQFFLIGPESQFELMDRYLARHAPGQSLRRLRPCHYWLTGTEQAPPTRSPDDGIRP
jgi:hypothetical protein